MAIIILFGLAGAGKTYAGYQLAQHLNAYFQDGDDWLTDEMRTAIRLKQPFTQEIRDRFTEHMIAKINALQRAGHENIIIAQGLYKQKNRQMIADALPGVIFIEVKTSPEVIIHRLQKRDAAVDENYANLISHGFESMPGSLVLHNDQEGRQPLQFTIEKLCQGLTLRP